MFMRMIFTAAAIATLAMPAVAQPTRPRPQPGPGVTPLPVLHRPLPLPHFCPTGTSWQYGCVEWASAAPGTLFGACVLSAWSCKRVGGPIQ